MTILYPLRCKTGVVRTRPCEIRSPNRPTRVMGRDHQAWADSRWRPLRVARPQALPQNQEALSNRSSAVDPKQRRGLAFDGCAGQLRYRMLHLKHWRVPTVRVDAAVSALRFVAGDVRVPTGAYVLDLCRASGFSVARKTHDPRVRQFSSTTPNNCNSFNINKIDTTALACYSAHLRLGPVFEGSPRATFGSWGVVYCAQLASR